MPAFPVYRVEEWQCRYVFPDQRCCGLALHHEGEHMPAKERVASPWLIAERARCRLEGLMKAHELFTRLPFPDAMAKLNQLAEQYGEVMKHPQPTGTPGE